MPRGLLLLGIDLALVRAWHQGRLDNVRWTQLLPRRSPSPNFEATRDTTATPSPLTGQACPSAFGIATSPTAVQRDIPGPASAVTPHTPSLRHLWLAWRQGRWVVAMLFILSLVILTRFPHLALLWSGIGALVCGLAAFGMDQFACQFRFVAEQGLDARHLWRVRQSFWGLTLLALVAACIITERMPRLPANPDAPNAWPWILLVPLGIYAIAQFASFYIRRFVVAAAVSVALSVPTYLWFALAQRIEAPWYVAAIPFPLLLVATLWRAREWFDERLTARQSRQLALLAFAPPVLVTLATSGYRAIEIPVTDPGFSVTEFSRNAQSPARVATLVELARPRIESEDETHQRQQAVVDEVHRLLAEPNRPLWNLDDQISSSFHSADFAFAIDMLRAAAGEQLRDGQLDEAWRTLNAGLRLTQLAEHSANSSTLNQSLGAEARLLDDLLVWAAHPNQTAPRVMKAVEFLTLRESQLGRGVDVIKIEHLRWSRVLEGNSSHGAVDSQLRNGHIEQSMRVLRWLVPSEVARSRRLLDHLTARLLSSQDSRVYTQPDAQISTRHVSMLAMVGPTSDGTDLRRWMHNSFVPPIDFVDSYLHWTLANHAQQLRSSRLRLALMAYRVRESRLPDSLDALVGDYLPSVPHSTITGLPFGYEPRGVPYDLESPHMRTKLPAGTPFLYSPVNASKPRDSRGLLYPIPIPQP